MFIIYCIVIIYLYIKFPFLLLVSAAGSLGFLGYLKFFGHRIPYDPES